LLTAFPFQAIVAKGFRGSQEVSRGAPRLTATDVAGVFTPRLNLHPGPNILLFAFVIIPIIFLTKQQIIHIFTTDFNTFLHRLFVIER
jgi:hypothetical protein